MRRALCQGGASGSGELTGAERQAWNKMFCLLQNIQKPMEVILPVRVDSRTGICLYLVSTKHLSAEAADQQNSIFMCPGFSYFPAIETYKSDDIHKKIYNEFRLYMGPFMDDKAYDVTP